MTENIHHVLSLSGGKDSSALAVYMRDRIPDMKYVFCDTQKELPETYDYLAKLESYLGKEIIHLCDDRGFDHWLKIYNNYLPSTRMRWCTKMLKIKPFERWVQEKLNGEPVHMYVGIRADEDKRKAYIPSKTNIKAIYPFRQDGIEGKDVHRILEESGLGLPSYYEWRTRSGCYFCFFQRKAEWVGLLERHPEFYELAKQYEKSDEKGAGYTWSEKESLDDLSDPQRIEEIKRRHGEAVDTKKKRFVNLPLIDVFSEVLDDEDDEEPCLMCHT